jgi:hypothetical protein
MKHIAVPVFSAAFLLLATTLSMPAQARPCGGSLGGFTLICRGNLQIQNHGGSPSEKDITFTRAANAAGTTGNTLRSGTCAWEDRPVNSAEPALIKGFVTADPSWQGWFTLVSQCAFNNRCTVEVCVANDGQGALRVQTQHAIVRFPF